MLHKDGFEMSAPVIRLNSDEKLKLSFDDLDGDLKRYRYTILHCEANWTTSPDLMITEYIHGFREENIDEYAYSYNTLVNYTHYSLVFPTRNLRPKISGNYVIRVYLDDPGNVAFAWRFMVVETSPAGIEGEARQANNIKDRFTRQEVDFTVHLNGMMIRDPDRELTVVITQNDRWDNALWDLKPKFNQGDVLDYNYNGEKTFSGGNEFRSFDIKSLVYQTERIRKIDIDSGVTRVYLLYDPPRTVKNYVTEKDINGRKFIKNEENAKNSDIEADYALVHFFLPFESVLTSGQIYILGALTDWQLNEASRMAYDYTRKGYEKRLLLKQGYYNYLYVFRSGRPGLADEGFIEGSHFETENEYTVWVYYRETGGSFDRLIAVQNFNTVH